MVKFFKWINENWQTVILVFTSLGSAYAFLGQKYRDIISAPFRKKKEKITLDDQELSFVEKLQKYQEERLTKILAENQNLYKQIEELKVKTTKDVRYIERCHEYIKILQRKLKNSNLDYPEFKND